MTSTSDTPASVSIYALVGAALLVLVAVAWGGATTRPADASVLGGLGLLWLLAPARRMPERGFVICGSGLLILATMAWLPAAWFPVEPWRRVLQDTGIDLPRSLSPQPWLSADAFVWLLAGLGWVAWLLGQAWDFRTRRAAMRLLAGGTAAIALVALVAWRFHFPVPGWFPDHPGFGPFPNRNHTGHVLALGAILALGCGADAVRRGWPKTLPWFGCAALLLLALVVNYSRGGLLLFFGGAFIWFVLEGWRRGSWKVLTLSASLVLVFASLVLIFGGEVAARFAAGAWHGDFRVLIWRDTLSLIHALPWCGAGLGNFRALFPLYRGASINESMVLHPESDWLWLATELGWPGVILGLGAVVAVLRGAFPLTEGSHRRLRAAALGAAIAALIHSTFDVPEHRLGSALMALLVLVLARADSRPSTEARVVGLASRIFGVAALVVAVILRHGPEDAARAETLSQAGRYADAEAAANRVLAHAPLDWRAYFTRAGARACRGLTLEAVADFRRARKLEPCYLGLPAAEAQFWMQSQPALALNAWDEALTAWGEALQRVRPPEDERVYDAILRSAPDNAGIREQLLGLTRGRPPLQIRWFQFAPAAEARAHFEAIAAAASQFSPAQREAFQRRAHEIEGAPAMP